MLVIKCLSNSTLLSQSLKRSSPITLAFKSTTLPPAYQMNEKSVPRKRSFMRRVVLEILDPLDLHQKRGKLQMELRGSHGASHSTESPKASQLVHSLNLSARKAARGAMAKPWYQNSKPASVKAATAAKVAKALPIEVEGLAVELGHLVKPAHQEHRPRGKEPSMGQSPSLDILQHLHPDRVNESLVLLEQVLESLQLIGQVCCCSFTGTFPIPPKVLSTRTCLNLP
jgi:hypothetical protein